VGWGDAEMIIEFDPQINAQETDIMLVGCGGTGSELAKIIARITYHMKALHIAFPKCIRFFDPDMVEEKNVGRQGFAPADIGQYKAEILAKRLGIVLGLEIEYYNEPYSGAYKNKHRREIILGAVDSHEGRAAMAETKDAIWIDCGNSRYTGQVVIGNTSDKKRLGDVLNSKFALGATRHLPNLALTYPEMLHPDPDEKPVSPIDESVLSCAELLARDQQGLLVNQQMALVAGEYLRKLLFRQPIQTHVTHVDSETLTMKSTPITKDYLRTFTS
jgi:PRTRC genetic system ThiF family protein